MSEFPKFEADDIIDLVSKRVQSIRSASTRSKKFAESKYRIGLEEEPDSSIDGMFYVDVPRMRGIDRSFGNGLATWEADVVVELGYFVGGGDAVGGDHKSVAKRATRDVQRVADVVEAHGDGPGYDRDNTGIVMVNLASEASRIREGSTFEVWAVNFVVRWDSRILPTGD